MRRILAVVALLACAYAVAAQDAELGFGLQASVFRNVLQATTNFGQDYEAMTEYELTPGDVFNLSINKGFDSSSGTQEILTYPVYLKRDYTIDVPILGTVSVAGKTIPVLQEEIAAGIRRVIPLEYVTFTLRSPAQFRVFVHGGVAVPGRIVATPLLGVIEAIASVGGFKPGASYRKVVLVRDGESIVLDLARYYSEADVSANPTLQPGDRIFVPMADKVVNLRGSVLYPGYYELVGEEGLETLLALAGGMMPSGVMDSVEIKSIGVDGGVHHRVVSARGEVALTNGDVIHVRSSLDNQATISIEGAFYGQPISGNQSVIVPRLPVRIDMPHQPGMSVVSLMEVVGGPTPYAEPSGGYILKSDGTREDIDLVTLWATRGGEPQRLLSAGDHVVLPMNIPKVFISGEVLAPGAYEHAYGLTLSDYLVQAGGINPDTGSPNAIFLVDDRGGRERIGPSFIPSPGDVIMVETNAILTIDRTMTRVFTVAGWFLSIVAVVESVQSLISVGAGFGWW